MGDREPKILEELPENAMRELAPGERYRPMVPDASTTPEITARSIGIGIAMTVIFSAAAAYISLKLGQGIESAIPISILAIGLSAVLGRKSTLLENVNIVVLGATAGVVVGGSTFTMPAIFVLGLEEHSGFFQIFLVPLLGAILGVFFLIPFRRYFVAEMHGKLPFPEATATTQILVTGDRGGRRALVLLYSMGVGMVVDFLALNVRLWRDTFTTELVPWLDRATREWKAIFVLNTSAAVLGIGYIVGLRYASIIAAGSFLSYYVFIPVFATLGASIPGEVLPGRPPLAGLDANGIFSEYVRHIGIGAIFAAGVLSIVSLFPVIVQAISRVLGEISRLGRGEGASPPRTEQDLPMRQVFLGVAVLSVAIFAYFRFAVLDSFDGATGLALVALVMTLAVSFLFAAVSAWAIAVISTTPISGMTLTTLILAALVMSSLGLAGPRGMTAILLIGGVVCTALSMTGSMVTMLKTGYWIGATPRRIELSLIGGSVLASITVTAVIYLLNGAYGFSPGPAHPDPVPAPQANAMAAVLESFFRAGGAAWFLYAIGAVVAVVVQMLGISALAFALGMYLPIDLNTPILVGAAVAWLVKRPSGSGDLDRARANRGTLIASGLIAGGALAGVLDALLKFARTQLGWPIDLEIGFTGAGGNWAGLGVFLLLGAYVAWHARRADASEGKGPEIVL